MQQMSIDESRQICLSQTIYDGLIDA